MVVDGLDHGFPGGLAPWIAIWVLGMFSPVALGVQHADVAREVAESLLHLGLVLLARPEKMMTLQMLAHVSPIKLW